MAAVAVSLSSQPVAADSKSAVTASSSESPNWPSSLSVKVRKSHDRGHANHGWLNSYHTFSFAGYYDEEFENFHSLRVINEDRVAPSRGFDTHPHREYEIFSYIVNGKLSHRDSMNNNEIIDRGEVQFTTAGTGISHSEYNASPKELVHFLQIWVKPSQSRLKPSYQTGRFNDAEKRGKLRLIVSPDGAEGSLTIHQDMKVYASLLAAGETVTLPVQPGREYYLHVVQHINGFDAEHDDVGVSLNDKKSTLLRGGDGAFLLQDKNAVVGEGDAISLTGAGRGKQITEFILFDVSAQS